MNRDIKFRGKRVDNGEWVEGWFMEHPFSDEPTTFVPCIVHDERPYQVIPESVGQYTGLKDMNEVEIYESDVVEASIYGDEKPQELTVEWRDGAFVIDYEDSEYDCVVIGLFVGSLKVIGHIHEDK